MLKVLCCVCLLIVPQLAHAEVGFGFRARLRGDYEAGGCTSAQASAHVVRERHVVHHRGFRAGSGCNGNQATGYREGGCTSSQRGGYYASVTVAGPSPQALPFRAKGGEKFYSTVPSELATQLLDEHAAANPGKRQAGGSGLLAILTEIITFLQAHNVSLNNIIAEVQRIIGLIHGTPAPAPVPG